MHGCAPMAVTYITTFYKWYGALRQCSGAALENARLHCVGKHKTKVLSLAFCVSRHRGEVAAFPPIPVSAAALCAILLRSKSSTKSWAASLFWQNKIKWKWGCAVTSGTGVRLNNTEVKMIPKEISFWAIKPTGSWQFSVRVVFSLTAFIWQLQLLAALQVRILHTIG